MKLRLYPEKKFLTTMGQANKCKREGYTLFCNYPGRSLAEITDIRFSQAAFQVKIVGSPDWLTPDQVWAEKPGEDGTLWIESPGEA